MSPGLQTPPGVTMGPTVSRSQIYSHADHWIESRLALLSES